MWFLLCCFLLTLILAWRQNVVITRLCKDNTKLLEGLKNVYKLKPDIFESPKTYQLDCEKACREMANVAKNCIRDISQGYK